MGSNGTRNLGDMLGGAGEGQTASGSGRLELNIGWVAASERLPRIVRRRLPADLISGLLLLAYAATAVNFLVLSWQAATSSADRGYLVFTIPVLCLAVAGVWFGISVVAVIPATLVWALIAVGSVFARPPMASSVALYGACFAVGAVVATRTLLRDGTEAFHFRQRAESFTNQLGWDLYRLSSEPLVTDESLHQIGVYRDLGVGEIQRHFDQVTSAALEGGMQHAFQMSGRSTSVHGLPWPLLGDTSTRMSMQGSGTSAVHLAMSGTTNDQLTGEAFMAVFDRPQIGGIDTLRVVVPSERQAREYISQLLNFWSGRLGANTKNEAMVRRYAGAIVRSVTADSSYVADRLSAILRMPASERPLVTVIGEPLDHHAVLAGAIRFDANGPLFQLFPIALVRALLTLISGQPMPPRPPSELPATSSDRDVDQGTGAAGPVPVAANGHAAGLKIRTLGGLRLTVGAEELTPTLLDRKVLAFLWLYLLARKLRNPDDTITRASLADELSPGLDSSTQRSRLRGRLSELRNQLPQSLGGIVHVEGERISLDLDGSEIDLRKMLDAARTYGATGGALLTDQVAEVQSLVDGWDGEFLPAWDDLEHHVNSGHGGSGEVVKDLRRRSETALSTLLRTLGAAYVAHGNPEAAIAPLERALSISPDDEAVVRSLVAACMQSGRLARADALRKDFGLG